MGYGAGIKHSVLFLVPPAKFGLPTIVGAQSYCLVRYPLVNSNGDFAASHHYCKELMVFQQPCLAEHKCW